MKTSRKLGGIVLVAGKSSRMGSFKPLLPFNGSTIIENTVLSLVHGGVENVVVVTGKNADEVEKVLCQYNVETVRNEHYENTDMLTSIKLGLTMLLDMDAVFIMPGDIPGVKASTIELLKEEWKRRKCNVLYPLVNGVKGHPPIIAENCFQDILAYRGDGGLREVLSIFKDSSEYYEIDDKGSILDIDYKEDYEKLLKHCEKYCN